MATESTTPVYTQDQINKSVEYPTNPSGNPGPNTQVFDDGSAVQTFADGSTKTIATDGSITTTGATDGSTTSQSGAGQSEVLKTTLSNFQSAQSTALAAATNAETAVQQAQDALAAAQAAGDPVAVDDAQAQLDAATRTLEAAQSDLSNAQTNVNTVQTALDAATNTGLDANGIPIVNTPTTPDNPGSIDAGAKTGAKATSDTTPTNSGGNRSGVPNGAQPRNPVSANAKWAGATDLRAKLRVPAEYLVGPAAGPSNVIQKNGGILFPYTPQISMQNQATYAQNTPLHSNYPLYFFKNGTVGPIQITAKFTVQNEFEGAVLLGVIHLLRGLTKMKWGNDPDAGAPPPVCRFDAYGDYMMQNIPVAITGWRHELPDNCDYIAVGRPGSPQTYGHSMVPTMSTITIDLNVMYSRQEMLAYNVKQWQNGDLVGKGYL